MSGRVWAWESVCNPIEPTTLKKKIQQNKTNKKIDFEVLK